MPWTEITRPNYDRRSQRYFPSSASVGQLEILPGFVVNAMSSRRALIIDEINRADIDKAFGELFTLLSGHDVDLPYLVQRKNIDGEMECRRIRLAAESAPDDPRVQMIRLNRPGFTGEFLVQ